MASRNSVCLECHLNRLLSHVYAMHRDKDKCYISCSFSGVSGSAFSWEGLLLKVVNGQIKIQSLEASKCASINELQHGIEVERMGKE